MLEKWKAVVCTYLREQRSSKGLHLCISAITGLHLSHVAGEYLTYVMKWIPYYFFLAPNSFWHGRRVLLILHQVLIGASKIGHQHTESASAGLNQHDLIPFISMST